MKNLVKINTECLTFIPQIVELLRMQSYFTASKKIQNLISNLNQIVSAWVNEEFLLILQCIMSAQEQFDYVLLADVLEGDLLPLLQKLQLEWLAQEKIQSEVLENTEYMLFPAVNGQTTLKYQKNGQEYCIHSTVNPEWEAQLFAKKYVQKDCEEYYIFGMGLGYHVLAVLQQSKRNRVIVLEREEALIRFALQQQDLSVYLKEGRMQVVCDKSIKQLLRQIKTDKEVRLLVHYPSLKVLPEGEEKEILENYFVSSNSMLEQKALLEENFYRLQQKKLLECSVLKEKYEGRNIAIVAGGPSVDYELETLKKRQKELMILTVGTTAKKLLDYGITPNAIVISDAQENMYQQIDQINHAKIPLILLSTASADVAEYYAGDIYLAYQEGFAAAEEKASVNGYMLFQTGGSVTTLALDIAIQFKARKIILVGTDMAYTNHQSHADGIGRTISKDMQLRKVEAIDGGLIETAKNLDIYRRWIEKRIGLTDIPVYNTARGARIHGTIEKNLESIE